MFHMVVFISSLQDCSDFQLHFAIQACAFYIILNLHDCERNRSVINSDKPVCIWKKYDNIVDFGKCKVR